MLKRNSMAKDAKQTKGSWRILLLFLVPLEVLAAAGSVRVEKTLETTPNPRISLSNLRGRVVVKGWDKSQVHAVYTTISPRVEVDAEALPSNAPVEKIHFTTHVLDPLATGMDKTADYVLEVPLGASLEVRNPEGAVQIEKLLGEASVDSVGGTISVTDVAGHLAVRSLGGDIEIIRSSGRVEASSICGNLHFVSPASSKLRGSTTSGKIIYEGDFVSGGDYELSEYSGDMDVFCPPSASFELSARSVKGNFESELPITRKRHSPSPLGSASSLFGTHNTGNATVELTSFSGNIHIRRQP